MSLAAPKERVPVSTVMHRNAVTNGAACLGAASRPDDPGRTRVGWQHFGLLLNGMHAAGERHPKMTFCCLHHRRHRLSKRVAECAVLPVPSACNTMAVHQACQARRLLAMSHQSSAPLPLRCLQMIGKVQWHVKCQLQHCVSQAATGVKRLAYPVCCLSDT